MTIAEFLKKTIDGECELEAQKKYLLDKKVDNPKELAEAVRFLRTQMPEVPKFEGKFIDVCGTGGSGLDTINTSTLSAILLASMGVKVTKHGNNSASGRFGSFDLLEAMDVPIKLGAKEFESRLETTNLAFLYAKSFHPVMRHFAAVRKELAKPTFFNYLGPLLSPVDAPLQVIGINDASKMQIVAETAKELGKQRVLVVHGEDGLDEMTTTAGSTIVELKDGKISTLTINPSDLFIQKSKPSDIAGGNKETNVLVAKNFLNKTATDAQRDIVLANAALAYYAYDGEVTFSEAATIVQNAYAENDLTSVLAEYKKPSVLRTLANNRTMEKQKNKQTYKTYTYTGGPIAEIKKASPSAGDIAVDIDVIKQAKLYEQAGAAAISIVTEPAQFKGSITDITEVKKAGIRIPILCKDFVTTKDQLDAIKSYGADMVLLIAALLSADDYKKLLSYAENIGLQVLSETHTASEIDMVVKSGAKILGINKRNLHDFSFMEDAHYNQLFESLPDDIISVAESGIYHRFQIPKKANGILVGTALLEFKLSKLKIKELITAKPLLKLCGVRSIKDATQCERAGVDLMGINFVPRSKRSVSIKTAKEIVSVLKNTIPVAIFEDHTVEEAKQILDETGITTAQVPVSRHELAVLNCNFIASMSADTDPATLQGNPYETAAMYYLIDNGKGGSGKVFDHSKLMDLQPTFVAGGINIDIAKKLLKEVRPLGIDTASGIETNGEVDHEKIKAFAELVNNTSYDLLIGSKES